MATTGIALAVVGGVLFLCCAAAGAFFVMRKKQAASGFDMNAVLDAEMALTKEQYTASEQ